MKTDSRLVGVVLALLVTTVPVAAAPEERQVMTVHRGPVGISGLAFSPLSDCLFFALERDLVRVDLPSAKERWRVRDGDASQFSVAVTTDAKHVVTGDFDGTIRVWDLGTGRLLRKKRLHRGSIASLVVTPKGLVVSAGSEWTQAADVTTLTQRWKVEDLDDPIRIALSHDARFVAYGAHSGSLRIREAGTGRLIRNIKADAKPVEVVAWGPKDDLVASGAHSGEIVLWDLEGKAKHRLSAKAPPGAAVKKNVRWSLDGVVGLVFVRRELIAATPMGLLAFDLSVRPSRRRSLRSKDWCALPRLDRKKKLLAWQEAESVIVASVSSLLDKKPEDAQTTKPSGK